MNTRQALLRSVEIEPDVLAKTIETQRKQLTDHLTIADRARAQEDWDMWVSAATHVRDLTISLEQNLEMQNSMRLSDLQNFTAGALVAQALKEALAGDKLAAKAINDAHKRLNTKKVGGANVRA